MSLAPLRTIRDVLHGAVPRESLAIQVLDNGKLVRSLTREELAFQIEAAAWELRRVGIRPGQTVSIAMGNTLEYIITFLAATWIRAVSAPLNPGYKREEFKFYMEDVQSRVLVVSESGNEQAELAAKELGVLVCRTNVLASANPGKSGEKYQLCESAQVEEVLTPSAMTWDPPIPTDVALYLHTSGTTSRPKLVPLTHHNLCTSMGNIRNHYELDWNDTCYLVMPLFHVHGLVGGLFSTLCSGGTLAIPLGGKFSAQVFWNDMLGCNATWYTAVPTIHQILLSRADADFPKGKINLRFIRSCSSSLAPAVMDKLEKAFGAPVLEAYAMTESSHQMTANPLPKNGPHKPGSVGRPANVQVAILDEENRKVPQGQIGEVCLRGENITTGYRNRPEANREAFAGGWFHTGDQGFLDQDGYLTLTGRIKELINRGGEKISPLEVDAVLLELEGVAEAVSFAGPSEKYGEEVYAAIVPKPGVKLTPDQVIDHCQRKMAREKVPTQVFISDQLPKTATGKIQRRFVAAAFLQSPNPASSKL